MVMKTKIIFLALVMISCSAVKKSTKTDVKSNVKSNIELKKSVDENTNLTTSVNVEKKADQSVKKNTSVTENDTEETTIHTINYVPGSKVDSLTKRPVVASETIQKTTKGKDIKAVESTELLYSQAEVQSLFSVYFRIDKTRSDSIATVISSLKSEITEKTKAANNWCKWLLFGMCVPVVGWVVWKITPWSKLSFIWRNI